MQDYLTEDMAVAGQKFCCLSFVSPTANQKSDVLGVKIRGSFETIEEAQRHAERLRNSNDSFDVYVASVGKWLPWYPDPSKMPDVNYQESQLNTIVKGHMEEQIKSKQHFEERKRDMMEKAMVEGSKDGQAKLADQPLHPVDLMSRLTATNAMVEEARKQLETLETSKSELESMVHNLTPDEISEAEHSALFSSDNINVKTV
jgi:flagellar biosynthesis/type III secretory pathway protein FliH